MGPLMAGHRGRHRSREGKP